MARQSDQHGVRRHYRHDDQFWVELIARWEGAGIGIRKFCEENCIAPSTFHKRRAQLLKREGAEPLANVMTPDACFIPVSSETMPQLAAPMAPSVAASTSGKSGARDSVVICSGGMRIELTGGHADRVVRHVLSRLGGSAC